MSTQLLMTYSVFAIYKNFTFLTVDYTSKCQITWRYILTHALSTI